MADGKYNVFNPHLEINLTGSLDSSDAVRASVVRTAASVGETLSHCNILYYSIQIQTS